MISEREIAKLYPKLRAFAKSYPSWYRFVFQKKYNLSETPTIGYLDTEDIVQKSLLEMIRYISKGDKVINNYEAFAINAIKFTVEDAFKKKKDSVLSYKPEEDEDEDDNPDPYENIPDKEKEGGFEKTLREQCLDKLKEDQRIVLIMNSFEGFTTEKISSVLENPKNTVLTWLAKAKREFADCILGKE